MTDQAAVGAQVRDQALTDLAFVQGRRATIGECAQCPGQVPLDKSIGIAGHCGWHRWRTVRHEEGAPGFGAGPQPALSERDRLRLIRIHCEPFFGEPDGRRHHLTAAEAATPEVLMRVQETSRLARHDRRPIPGVLDVAERSAPAIHAADAGRRRQLENVLTRRGGCRTRAVDEHRPPIRRGVHHHGRDAADTAHGWFDDADRKGRRDSRVDRVAARP